MEILYHRCAGLDVHSKMIAACARIAEGNEVRYEERRFDTTTTGLLELADWLDTLQVTHVAMESTGVFWKPVWHILAERFQLVLANAAQVKSLRGKKSDRNDAKRISDLLAIGMITPSFVAEPPIQELRDLTRTRRQLLHEITRHKQRILKTYEDCNLKPGQVMSDVFGLTGRKVLRALIEGMTSPDDLADLAEDRLRAPKPRVVEALRGRVTSHHRFMLQLHLEQIESLEGSVRKLEAQTDRVLEPFRAQQRRLMTIPGISSVAAATLLAELGADMSRFPSAGHARSWAGLSPGLNESAGKVLSRRTGKSGMWLKPVLVQAALSATKKKNCYYGAQFRRIRARRGGMKALVAVAASMLTAAYYILRDGSEYRELGPNHFDVINRTRLANRFVRRLKELGYEVAVKPAA